MPCEVIVTLKDDEKRLRNKFLIYEDLSASLDDPCIKMCIENALKDFHSTEYDVKVKINLL